MTDDYREDPFKKYGGQQVADQEDPFKKYGGSAIEEPAKKKILGGVGALAQSKNGGQSSVSKSSWGLGGIGEAATASTTNKFTPADYIKQFEDVTGHKELDLGSTLPQIQRAKENSKYLKYKSIEENELNPLQAKVQSGTVQPKDLSDLYNKPYGKKVVGDIINNQVPEVGSAALESDVYGNEGRWDKIAKALQSKNRQQGIDAQNQYEFNLDQDVYNDLNKYDYGNTRIAVRGGGEGFEQKDIKSFGKIDTNNSQEISSVIEKLNSSEKLFDKEGKEVDEKIKAGLLQKLQEKLLFIKSQEPLHPEILQLPDEIERAVKSVSSSGWKKSIGLTPEQVQQYEQKDIEYVKAGLNYMRDANPGQYKNIMRGIGAVQKIADTDYEDLIKAGRLIKNQQDFKSGEIVKEDDRDFSTYQTRRANLSGQLSEKIKQLGYKNSGKVSDKAIIKAATELGVDPNSEELKAIRLDEANGGYGIVKGGGLTAFMRGVASPFKAIQQTFNTTNPTKEYLNSRRYDYGDQKIPDESGNVSDVLPSERKLNSGVNFFNKALEGVGQFTSQILLARGIGAGLEAPYNFGTRLVPRAALTAEQSTNLAAYGGGFLSTVGQTYGQSYLDFLQKTGNPNKASYMATIDAAGQAALEVGVLPDVKIAEKMKGALSASRDKLAKGIIGVVEKGGKSDAAKPFFETFLKETANILGKEVVGEEVSQNAWNYFDEMIFSPQTAKKRNLGQESIETIKEAGVQMLIPAIMGGFGGAKNKAVQRFTKDALNTGAINFDKFQEELTTSLANGQTSQQDYDKAIDILQSHRESLDNTPKRDAEGNPISMERQLEYAFQDTIAKENQSKANSQQDPIQKEPFEKKIKEADDIKRKIFYGEEEKTLPPKQEEEPQVHEAPTDEDILATIKSSPEVTGAEQEEGLQYFVDKIGEAPIAAEKRFGKDAVDELIQRVPTEKLEENYKFLAKIDPTSPEAIELDRILGEREASREQSPSDQTFPEGNRIPVEEGSGVADAVGGVGDSVEGGKSDVVVDNAGEDQQKAETKRVEKVAELEAARDMAILREKVPEMGNVNEVVPTREAVSAGSSADNLTVNKRKRAELKNRYTELQKLLGCLMK